MHTLVHKISIAVVYLNKKRNFYIILVKFYFEAKTQKKISFQKLLKKIFTSKCTQKLFDIKLVGSKRFHSKFVY